MEQNKFYQIKNVTEHEYTLVGCDGSVIIRPIQEVDKTASVFTIEDAKDGDVLATNDWVFIFKGINNNNNISCYCHYDYDEDMQIFNVDTNCYMTTGSSIYPATKEQSDLLFSKMKEAGYEWDAEKTEVKLLITNGGDFESENCEQKPVKWSEEDEIMVEDILDSIDDTIAACDYHEMESWLKSLKERIKE